MAKVTQEIPEKIVIVAGPTFCEALKFTLFGAFIGATVIHFMSREQTPTLEDEDAVEAGLTAGGLKPTGQAHTSERLSQLATRAKGIAGRAVELAHSASDAIKPALEQAVAQGKLAAAEIEAKLKKEVEEAGDRPALAEAEEKAAAREDKYVE